MLKSPITRNAWKVVTVMERRVNSCKKTGVGLKCKGEDGINWRIIGANSTGETGTFAPVLARVLGREHSFAPVAYLLDIIYTMYIVQCTCVYFQGHFLYTVISLQMFHLMQMLDVGLYYVHYISLSAPSSHKTSFNGGNRIPMPRHIAFSANGNWPLHWPKPSTRSRDLRCLFPVYRPGSRPQ